MKESVERQPARLNRRDVLVACGGLAAAGVLRPGAVSTQAAAPEFVALADGIALITDAGGNIVVLEGAEGLLLVDSGDAAHAPAVKSMLADRFPDKPVEVMLNTHWHLDHTGGNDVLGAGTIVAHENTRLWMSTTFYVDWEDRRYVPRSPEALPNTTFFSSDPQPMALDFAGERIVYAHLPKAHTDGDIYVYFPERNLIVAGGTVTNGRYPVIDYITGGWIGGLAEATQTLIGLAGAGARIVPDAGAPVGVADLELQHTMLTTVRERIEAIALEGRGIDDMLAAGITEEFDARYGDPSLFIENAYHGLWWNRLRGIVA